jgi:hypothetical protein
MRLTLSLVIASALLASPLLGQRIERRMGAPDSTPPRRATSGVVEGFVTDTNMVPVAMADVRVMGTDSRLYTGSNGRFRFTNVPARHEIVIIARRIGFSPTFAVLGVDAGDTTRINLALERFGNLLDTVRVTARASRSVAGFEMRKQRGLGDFFTQETFERTSSITNVLRRARGVQILQSEDGYVAVSQREGMSLSLETGRCAMSLVIDGMVMPKSFPLDHLPDAGEIFGMEVYNSPTGVPPEYHGAAACGIVFIWTKSA